MAPPPSNPKPKPMQPTAGAQGIVAGAHGRAASLPILVAPSTQGEQNVIRPNIIPLGCFKIEDVRFDFDSSFIRPDLKDELVELKRLIDDHTDKTSGKKPPATIFGHADPVGQDEYNKTLSGRRAEATYAVLIRDADRWEKLFSNPAGGDKWGTGQIQTMLTALGHDPGPVTGQNNDKTKAAIKDFQSKNGLAADGVAGPNTRKKLFQKYMDFLAGDLKLDMSTDFLAKGADKDGKGDFQGCGEFNPLMVFSKAEVEAFKKSGDTATRNKENAVNRRVMVLLFRPGLSVEPAKWPCPRAKEGGAGCRARFFSDGDSRRENKSARREFKDTKDTFACRFYHLQVTRSPCELPVPAPDGLGFLSVRVFFHQEPMQGLRVQFHEIAGDSLGNPIGDEVLTDINGTATLDRFVTIGHFACVIEHQRPKGITTVDDPDDPLILVLPIGRPLTDFQGDVEFIRADEQDS